jgi:hypothetical protein
MISTIITSVGMIMLFLGIFFFGYASSVEQDIVKINTDIVTTDLLNIIEVLYRIELPPERFISLIKSNLLHNLRHASKSSPNTTCLRKLMVSKL